MTQKLTFTAYANVDTQQLHDDIEAVKKEIGPATKEDFQHLLKLERWGRLATFLGYALIATISALELFFVLSGFVFLTVALLAAILISTGNVSRWANVSHPILHGAYDKVPNIPKRYTRKYFAKGNRRVLDWLDWITPEAWSYEHNIMHHYNLGEHDDPDCIQRHALWLCSANTPKILKYPFVMIMTLTWKLTYYARNTLSVLNTKKGKDQKGFNREFFMNSILFYSMLKFVLIPLLFLPLGWIAVLNALIIILIAEALANLHSFIVIVPNHSAEDIYLFDEPTQKQSEFYLRQIMGSVNYHTGGDVRDFMHGWLNYQIEHHLFPSLTLRQYQKIQPEIQRICAKHNLEYRQESVFVRFAKTLKLFTGNTNVLRVTNA